MRQHTYEVTVIWTGNRGEGTKGYAAYDRDHTIQAGAKPVIPGSADPAFRGDKSRYNPEEMLVASLSSCHMLWYLHLCSEAGVVVLDYTDKPTGIMVETADGGGYFTEVTLRPVITVAAADMIEKADELHHKANSYCFIANSCRFPVHHQAEYVVKT